MITQPSRALRMSNHPSGETSVKRPFVVSLSNHEWPFAKPALRLSKTLKTNGACANEILGFAAAILLTGCTTTIPVISTSLECPIKPESLTAKCAEPAPIAPGATYQDLIRTAIEDRQHLAECEKSRQFLQDAINECNAAIRKHNETIDELNRKYANKP